MEALAIAYANAKKYNKAIELFRKCLQKCTEIVKMEQFENYLASLYEVTGDFDQYQIILERTLARDPNNLKAKLRLCKFLIHTGDLDTTVTISLEAIPKSSILEFIDILAEALELRNEPLQYKRSKVMRISIMVPISWA